MATERILTERNDYHKWRDYERQKRNRERLELSGAELSETYSQFIARITRELGI